MRLAFVLAAGEDSGGSGECSSQYSFLHPGGKHNDPRVKPQTTWEGKVSLNFRFLVPFTPIQVLQCCKHILLFFAGFHHLKTPTYFLLSLLPRLSSLHLQRGFAKSRNTMINPLSPNIKMQVLSTVLYTFVLELIRRICLQIGAFSLVIIFFILIACPFDSAVIL